MDSGNPYDPDKAFVDLILKAREYRTRAGVADLLGVSQPTIDRWMQGKNLPHLAMREPIRKILERRMTTR